MNDDIQQSLNQILVVDDNIGAAKEYARLIFLKCRIHAIAVDNPNEAIEVVKNQPIKIVILDQKMPLKPGTELFKDLKKIDPKIRAIMLSGDAAPEEVGEAFNIGYIDYLHKSKVEELPNRVFIEFTRRHIDEISETKQNKLTHFFKKSFLKNIFKHSTNFFLHSVSTINEEYVFPDKWETIKQIKAGEEIEFKDKIDITEKYIHEESNKSELISKFSFAPKLLNEIISNLEMSVRSEIKNQLEYSNNLRIEVTRKYKLPSEPVNPTDLHVISRHFQRAKVYKQVRYLILKKCDCCILHQIFPVILFHVTNKIATKHQDYYSDGISKEYYTGIESIPQ